MKYLLLLLILITASCNYEGMSDEQRKKLKQEKAARKIQRVTEAEILTAAKARAEAVFVQIKKGGKPSAPSKWISLQDSLVNPYEQQIQEAYQYTLDQGLEFYDNIEDLKDGNIVYTKPSLFQDSIQGFWVIMLDKKEVIKGMQ